MLLSEDSWIQTVEMVKGCIEESIDTKVRILKDDKLIAEVAILAEDITRALKEGYKVLTCGNGGSASDALHIAGELVGRFQMERPGYSAIALNADIATLTAIANDYGYEQIFSRQVEALMEKGDILIGISTSGNSANLVKAFERARELGGRTALLTGRDGGELKRLADYKIIVPSDVTARIQESHMCIYHIICELVESGLEEKAE